MRYRLTSLQLGDISRHICKVIYVWIHYDLKWQAEVLRFGGFRKALTSWRLSVSLSTVQISLFASCQSLQDESLVPISTSQRSSSRYDSYDPSTWQRWQNILQHGLALSGTSSGQRCQEWQLYWNSGAARWPSLDFDDGDIVDGLYQVGMYVPPPSPWVI
jgi:hypothetical protein